MDKKLFINARFALEETNYETDGEETRREFKKLNNIYKGMDTQDFEPVALFWYDDFIKEKMGSFLVKVSIDDVGYTEKPKEQEEIKKLNNRIGAKEQWLEFSKFADMVGSKGHTFCPAIFESDGNYAPRRKSNFSEQQIFALDFDGEITYEEVLQRTLKYNIPPAFIYKTLSCDDVEINKFRVVWIADFIINDVEVDEGIIKLLMTIFPETDKSCKDCCRMFFGGKGIIYLAEYPYLCRLSLVDLASALNNYIKDNYYKNRTDKMREICKETGFVLNNGILDIKQKRLTDEQFHLLEKYSKPAEYNMACRFYVLLSEAKEILNEDIFDEEGVVYVAIRKICAEDNIVYFIRMNRNKKIKKKVATVTRNKGKITYKTKSNAEYKVSRKAIRGIHREMLFEKCLLIQDFVNDEYLTFDELFGICTNLTCIEGGLHFFKDTIQKSKHNIARSTDWFGYKADEIYAQLLFPERCENFCDYKGTCKHGKNIIQTVKTKRKKLVQVGDYELITLEQGIEKYKKILEELFENE